MATDGYFEEAAGFLPGNDERLKIQLVGLTQPLNAVGTRVTVQVQPLDPHLLFCPRINLESFLAIAANDLDLNATVAVTCCASDEAERLILLLEYLGAQLILRKVRNLFSGMAAGGATYDEHGWVTVFKGISADKLENLKLEEFLKSLDVQAEKVEKARSPAVFWGILDLKYDPTLPMEQRVKVLETGDGRSSKFSGYGAAIKENFKADKRLEETLHRAVLVENKKLTHEFFVESGYEHLMPRQMCFRRKYYDTLALDLIEGLQLKPANGPEKACVLKLCNRARGAGCIPIQAADLDLALERLLKLPEDAEEWLKEQDDAWFSPTKKLVVGDVAQRCLNQLLVKDRVVFAEKLFGFRFRISLRASANGAVSKNKFVIGGPMNVPCSWQRSSVIQLQWCRMVRSLMGQCGWGFPSIGSKNPQRPPKIPTRTEMGG